MRKVVPTRVVLAGQLGQYAGQPLLGFTSVAMSEQQRSMGDGGSSPMTDNSSRFSREYRNLDLCERSSL